MSNKPTTDKDLFALIELARQKVESLIYRLEDEPTSANRASISALLDRASTHLLQAMDKLR